MNNVKEFWDNQAKKHGTSNHATAPDHFYRSLEIKSILNHLPDRGHALDIGCGNGYSTLKFAEARPNCKFVGMDFSEPMIEAAKQAQQLCNLPNVEFMVGDVRNLTAPSFYDTILTERCLINLGDWDEQSKAIMRIWSSLKKNGRAILVENTVEGLAALNYLRRKFDLHEIRQPWHNRYILRDRMVDFLGKHGFHIQAEQNIGCMYYILSRVLYAKMADLEGEEPDYDHVINEIASQLPTFPHYHYSPNVLWLLRKEVP